MRLALIARACNSGLGTLSREFARHLRPEKVLIVQNGVYEIFPERYAEFPTKVVGRNETASPQQVDWLLTDVDVLLTFETFYSPEIVVAARRKGVKTVLMTMCEMTPERLPLHPDLFLCPSSLDLEIFRERFPSTPSVYLPVPVARDRLFWRLRTDAKHFVHTASHGGLNGRKGTSLLLEAMKHVKAKEIRLTVYSWQAFRSEDPRVEIRVVNFKNYWQAWREGDVLVYPQGANGISLPCVEALSSGLGVITTDQIPFNEYLPKRLLFPPSGFRKKRMGPRLLEVDDPMIDPLVLAAKIDEVAGDDITEESLKGREYAEANSWDVLAPKYLELFSSLCRNRSST